MAKTRPRGKGGRGMSQQTIIWASVAPIVAVNLYLFWRYLKASDRFSAARAKRQRLYMLHGAQPANTFPLFVGGQKYSITNFANACYIIQSPTPIKTKTITPGVLDLDTGAVDTTLCLLRLEPGILVEPALYCFIKKNY